MSRIWLHQAAINGDVEALRRELANGYAVDEYDEAGMTLLHSLCSNRPGGDDDPGDRLACFHLLIEAGADPTKRTAEGGWFPLLFAADQAHTELCTRISNIICLMDAGSLTLLVFRSSITYPN